MENILVLLIVGLVAGWLAGLLYKGSGFGLIGNIIVGLIGSVLGGFLAGVFGVTADNVVGTILVATVGAIVLLVIVNFFSKGRIHNE